MEICISPSHQPHLLKGDVELELYECITGFEPMAKHAWAQAAVRGLIPTCKISPSLPQQ